MEIRLVRWPLLVLLTTLGAGSPGDAATDCTLVPAEDLFTGGTEADADALELETAARNGGSVSPLEDVDPALAASVQAFLASVGADESIVTSGYRPLPYQGHLYALSTEFKEIAAARLPGVRVGKGAPPRFEIVNETRFAADPRSIEFGERICVLNQEIAHHGLLKGKGGGLAVNPPEDSEHTSKPAQAVDISIKALRGLGLSHAKIAEFACMQGLWRPFAKTDAVHFERIPEPGDPRLVPLTVEVIGGEGSYTLDPPGGSYVPGCVVTVTPVPAEGFMLASAPGCLSRTPTRIRMQNRETYVCIKFKEITVGPGTVMVIVVGPGHVTSFPDNQINCPGGSCVGQYTQSQYPFLNAVADEGHYFVGWDLDNCFAESCPLVPQDFKNGLTITATFE